MVVLIIVVVVVVKEDGDDSNANTDDVTYIHTFIAHAKAFAIV